MANARDTYGAETLVVARRRKGWSQRFLAQRLGIDQSTVSRLEHGGMANVPWRLLTQACQLLDLDPQAVVAAGPGDEMRPGFALALVRARISHHFLYLGYWQRLPEMLQYCLAEMARVRPSVVGVHLLVFGQLETRHFYALWRDGESSFAERIEPEGMTPPVRRLYQLWETQGTSLRAEREETAGWRPGLAVDYPMPRGMLGVDFSRQEDPARHETLNWVSRLAETYAVGLDVVAERGGDGYFRDDLNAIALRLAAIEARLVESSTGAIA